MKITSIALDLDGTTLNSQGVLSERTRRALVRAAQSGICVIPASGRSFDSLPGEILRIPEVRYVITSNGTAVVDVHTGTYLRKFVLTEESVEKILLLMEDEQVAYEAFIDGKAYAQSAYVEDPEPIPLSKKELQLLLCLMENACQILTREQILEQVWGMEGQFVDDNTVPVNISRLKGKIGGSYIQNVRGIGYIWTEESFRE